MSILPKLLDYKGSLGGGIAPDKHALLDHIWETAKNVKFTPNGVKKAGGVSRVLDDETSSALPIRGINQLLGTSGRSVFYGDATSLYRWDSSSLITLGSSYTGEVNESVTVPATSWSFVEWGNWMVASNGQDPIQVWKGAEPIENLGGGPPATAEILVKKDVNILAFNVPDEPTAYYWCARDNIEDWEAVAEKTAGFNTIRDFDSAIIAAVPLGTDIAVYSIDRMVLVSTQAAPYYFGHGPSVKGVGAVSKYSVVEVGRFHYGVSRKGFFRTDGVTHEWLDTEDVRETFLANINWDQKTKINGFHDERNTEIVWFYPSSGSNEPDLGIGYNYLQDVWTFYDFGYSASQEQRVFDYAILADSTRIYWNDLTADRDGSILEAYVRSKPLAFSETYGSLGTSTRTLEDYFKFIQAVQLGVVRKTGTGLYLKLGYQDELDEPILWFTHRYLKRDVEPIYPGRSDRWVTIEVGSDQLTDTWELQTLAIHGKKTGKKR